MSSVAGASLDLDARALALLDALLDTAAPERERQLAELARTEPALQQRVLRLLAACDDEGSSRALLAPALGELRAVTQPARAAGQRVAGWRLLRELGRGGMAEVWLAERADGGLKREAAIKLPLLTHGSAVLAERFARERDVLATLDHPHIARLHDAGVDDDGQPYIVMEFVAGLSITAHAQSRGLGQRQRLALFQQVLAAVDHAHRHLVVHRDLKPSNVLVTEDGQVKLLDFGIAKLLAAPADASALTQDAAVLTPRYAAPEQVLGTPVSTATDVYAAGVLLHELLTGRLPYGRGELTLPLLVQAVVQVEPAAPGLGTDLDTVLLKALRKKPEDRYASAERFGEDLRRLLADEPILARRVPVWQRLRLLLRRHRLAAAVGGAALALLLVTAGLAWQGHLDTVAQEQRANAVRSFLFLMMSDVEPVDGSTGAEVTGRQIVAAAIERARDEFASDPVTLGEILGELGRIQLRLGQTEQAGALLRETIALLEPRVPGRHGGLNSARAWLAQVLIREDKPAAQAVAEQALAACSGDDLACGKARSHAHAVLRNLHATAGNTDAALLHAREAVAASTAAFGPTDINTAAAWQFLAVVARNATRLEEASDAIRHAAALSGEGSRIRAAERISLERTQALIAIELGQYAAARRQLEALVQRTPEGGERAGQWRLLSAALYGLGDAPAAMRAAAEGATLAQTLGDRRSQWLARQAEARALALDGQAAQALAVLQDVAAGLAALGYAPETAEMLRVQHQRAEAQWRLGDIASARATLDASLERLAAATPRHPVDRGQAQDLAGLVALAQGRGNDALALFDQARQAMGSALPEAHPLRLRNRVYAAHAQSVLQPSASARAALESAVTGLRAKLEPGSAWWHASETFLAPAAGTPASHPSPLF